MSTDVQTEARQANEAPDPTPTAPRAAWLTVARREIIVRLGDKAFLGGTLFTLVLLVGFTGWQVYDASKTSSYTVVSTQADAAMADRVAQDAPSVDEQASVRVDVVADASAARAAVTAGEADAWLHPGDTGWVLTTLDSSEGGLERITQEVVREAVLEQQAEQLGTTAERLQQGSTVTAAFLRGDPERSQVTSAVSFAFGFLFYIAALTFGLAIAGSVVEEKQSRVVEIIATSIPVRQLLIGKVVGTSLIAMVQMTVYTVVGLVGLSFTPYSAFLPAIGGPVAWYLAFFVVGFVALACLYAVAGALASRSEDVQSTGTPLIVLVLATFLASVALDGSARTVASFVPPFSTVLMPARLLDGSAAWWEAVLALALLAVAAFGVIRVAERLYRRSLLQTGGRLSLRRAWSAPE